MTYRWTTHRVFDGSFDYVGRASLNMWWVARAAAEETLQGSPLAPAWLKLFRTHLSENDKHWLVWRGDLAASAELRRAYSGLYGRFFARALLSEHLGLSNFTSLERNGVTVGSVRVERTKRGDIPDWIAWDDANSRYVLCEAKGSLASNDFLRPSGPQCARDGKKQFSRVRTLEGTRVIHPAQWVAATRWATDDRGGDPVTLLWDPPVDEHSFGEEEAKIHRTALTRAWLDSLAPALGWKDAGDLLAKERSQTAITIRAEPGPIPDSEDWPPIESRYTPAGRSITPLGTQAPGSDFLLSVVPIAAGPTERFGYPYDWPPLVPSPIYPNQDLLVPQPSQTYAHNGSYITAMITPFGITPIRSQSDYERLLRQQQAARDLEEPAMLVGIPLGLDPSRRKDRNTWVDGAGISSPDGLSVFDLRRIDTEPLETLKS